MGIVVDRGVIMEIRFSWHLHTRISDRRELKYVFFILGFGRGVNGTCQGGSDWDMWDRENGALILILIWAYCGIYGSF